MIKVERQGAVDVVRVDEQLTGDASTTMRDAILERLAPGRPMVVIDMAEQTVTSGAFSTTFTIDAFAKHRLMNGLDNIGLTLEHRESIDDFEAARPGFKPTVRG